MSAVDFRNVRLSEFDQIKALFESFYGANYYLTEPKIYRWLHHDTPFRSMAAGDDEFTAFAAFDPDAGMISCINYVPTKMWIGEHEYPMRWSVGWYSLNEANAVGGLLLRRHLRLTPFYMSMGATQWVRNIYVSLFGFTYQHNIPRLIMLADVEAARELLGRNPEPQPVPAGSLERWAAATARAAERGRYHLLDHGAELDPAYWDDHRGRVTATTDKSPDFIRWRYTDNPNIRYEIISTDAEQDGGIAVLRFERARGDEFRVGRLVEYLPRRGREGDLADAVARRLVDGGAMMLDFYCGARTLVGAMPEAFVQMEDHLPLRFPQLFQPVEWRERYSINTSFRRNKADKTLPEIDIEDVYFTKGDPIQDVVINPEYKTLVI